MRQHVEALHQLARIAVEGSGSKESLAQAATIIRLATGAAQAMVVYAEDQDLLVCSDPEDGAAADFTQIGLWMVQRRIIELGGPVGFNLIGHRVEDFTSAFSRDERDFLAVSVPTSESPSEMCILRGPWEQKRRADILHFMGSAVPALTLILERFLNADRSRRQGEQLYALANAAQVLTRSEDVEAALTDLATAIAASAGFEYIVNMDLYDATTGRFTLRILGEHRHTSGTLAQVWRASLDPDRPDPWKAEAMNTLQPVCILDVQNDQRVPRHVRLFFTRSLLRSLVVFPMLFQDEFLGTVSFVSFKPRTFPPEEASLLQGFVTQAAMAIKALQMHKELQRYAHELKRSADEYIATTNLTGDMIVKLDKHGRWAFLNDAACQFLGKSREELVGTDSRAWVYPEDLEPTAQAIRETRARRELTKGFVNRLVTPMGTRVVEWDGYPLFDEESQYAGIQMTGRDITERKQMEEALRESEGRVRTILESVQTGIVVIDPETHVITDANSAAVKLIGAPKEEVIGSVCHRYICPADRGRCPITDLGQTVDNSERVLLRAGGESRPIIKTVVPVNIGGRKHLLESFVDITERKRAEEEREKLHAELKVRAITDGLTSLYNHAHFYERLAEEIDRCKRYERGFALVMMDIDAFKQYNDSRGHQAGDEMLRLIADCIRAGLRRSDLPFRYGGDEFAAILLNADLSRAQRVVNRINRRIAARLEQLDDPAAPRLGLSAGVASFPQDAASVDELVRMADASLYNAKRIAWARGVTAQGQPSESPPSSTDLVDEAQSPMLSTAASSLAAVLRDLGAGQFVAEPNLSTIATLGAASEVKDRHIRGHQERTSLWAAALAEEMGLPPERVLDIRIAGLLHDIGKAGVSQRLLNKPGKLTEEEFANIKEHAPLGAEIMVSEAKALQQLATIVRHHHERFDGNGYPDGLAAEEIPLEARILSVVDVFDAMTHERSYRKALSRAEAIVQLADSAGTHFDPRVVEAFLVLLERRDDELAAPAQAASGDRQSAAARAGGPAKR